MADVGRRVKPAIGDLADRQRWPVICVLVLVVVSDFQVRLRPVGESLAGSPDVFVAIEVATYAAVAVFLFLRFRPRFRLRRPRSCAPLVYLAYGYPVVVLVAAIYSPYLMLALVRAGQVVVVVALFAAVVRHASRAALHQIAHGYVALIAAAVVFGVVVPYPRLPTQLDRFTWLYVHPVKAGELMAIAVVLAFAYLTCGRLRRYGPRWPVPMYLAMLTVCAAGLTASNTRGAMLGAMAGVAVVLLTRWRGSRKVEVGIGVAIVAALVALTAWPAIEEFFVRGESAKRLASLNSRTILWEEALRHIGENPLYGSGLSASRGLFLETLGLGGGHNALINVLLEIGIVGALVWLCLLLAVFIAGLRLTRLDTAARTDGIIAVALLACLIVNSIFTEELGAAANATFTWLYVLAAWMVLATRTSDQESAERQA